MTTRSALAAPNPSGSRALGLAPSAEGCAGAEGSAGSVVAQSYARLRAAQRASPHPDYAARRELLASLAAAVRRRASDLIQAASLDFGGRSANTTKIGDLATTLRELDYMQRHLRAWMAPEKRRLALHFRPARGRVEYQPLGVVGVISPWNYPIRLALGPLAAALAAGNRVLLKPSELAPHSAACLKELLAQALPASQVEVLLGAETVAQELCALPLDHLFFTGSTRVGKHVMRAAAQRLTPVTLELGGKCPVVIHPSASLESAARRIVAGKLFNAGQTCMAPDHVWVHSSQRDELLAALRGQIQAQYPTLVDNPDYTAIISSDHMRRLSALVDDARTRGARVELVTRAGEVWPAASRKVAPTLIADVSDDMKLAEEEIFGPLLPVRTFESLDEVFARLSQQPSPLAAYYFDSDASRCREWLRRTRSGGACINDVVVHGLQDDLPFGGVGASGMGRYHGREGFLTFSNQRGVLYQTRRNWTELLIPPYGALGRRVIDWLSR